MNIFEILCLKSHENRKILISNKYLGEKVKMNELYELFWSYKCKKLIKNLLTKVYFLCFWILWLKSVAGSPLICDNIGTLFSEVIDDFLF